MDIILLWLTMVLCATFNIFGDLIGKIWTCRKRSYIIALAMLAYAIDQFFFATSLTGGPLAKNVFIVFILAAIIDVCIGRFYFKEHVTKINTVGLLLGVVALVILI